MIEDNLTEFQKKRIKERISLNFKEELYKSKTLLEREVFYKNFSNELDIFVNELSDNGVLFYGFSIKMPFLKQNDSNIWYITHLQIESWINLFRDDIELIEFSYLSIELENDNYKNVPIEKDSLVLIGSIPFFKGIIGIRSLVGENKSHLNEIKKIFNLSFLETKVELLNSPKDIILFWDYVIKEKNFKFHRFTQYSKFFDFLYGGIADLELQYDSIDHVAFCLDENLNSKFSSLSGVGEKNPYVQTIIGYLFTIFMDSHKYTLNNNFIFQKNKNSQFSWLNMGSIDWLQKNKILILKELKQLYPQQLGNLSIHKILIEGWDIFYADLKKNNEYLPCINIVSDVIEFKDGIYFFNGNKFLNFSKIEKTINSKNFVNKNFISFKKKKPKKWLNYIGSVLIKYDLLFFCELIGKYFNSFMFIDKEKKIINIGCYGLVKMTFNVDIVGVIDRKNFCFEQIIINKNDNNKIINNFITIIFNDKVKDEMFDDRLFINRVIIYIFTSNLLKNIKEFNNILIDNELFEIMFFCNNIFNKNNKLKKKISNK